eukprot:COSAG05_NODE_793_length_7295_cov_2.666481_11_plen_389_part_00
MHSVAGPRLIRRHACSRQGCCLAPAALARLSSQPASCCAVLAQSAAWPSEAARQEQMDEAVDALQRAGDASASRRLLTVVQNVLQQPNEPRFRTLRACTNPHVGKLLRVPGARELLASLGFAEEEETGNLVLTVADTPLLSRAEERLSSNAAAGQQPHQSPEAPPPPDNAGCEAQRDTQQSHVSGLREQPMAYNAGRPAALHSWDARYMRAWNRSVALDSTDATAFNLGQLFTAPTLAEFTSQQQQQVQHAPVRGDHGIGWQDAAAAEAGRRHDRPMIFKLRHDLLHQPSGVGWPTTATTASQHSSSSGASDDSELLPPWVQRTAQLAAAAVSATDGHDKRLVVVNPKDPERKSPNPALEEAMAQCRRSGLAHGDHEAAVPTSIDLQL